MREARAEREEARAEREEARAEREAAAREARAEREAAEFRRKTAEELLRLEAERLAKSAAPDAVTTLIRTTEVLRALTPPPAATANPFELARSALALAKELAPPPTSGLSEITGAGRFFQDVVGTLVAAGNESSPSSSPAPPSVPMGQYMGVTMPLAQVLALQQQDIEQQAAEVLRIKEDLEQRLAAQVAAAPPAASAARAAALPAPPQVASSLPAVPAAAPPASAQAAPTAASPAGVVPAPASPAPASADHGAAPAVAQFSAPARAERAAAQPAGAPATVTGPAKAASEPSATATASAPHGASAAPAGPALVRASEITAPAFPEASSLLSGLRAICPRSCRRPRSSPTCARSARAGGRARAESPRRHRNQDWQHSSSFAGRRSRARRELLGQWARSRPGSRPWRFMAPRSGLPRPRSTSGGASRRVRSSPRRTSTSRHGSSPLAHSASTASADQGSL